LEIEDCGNVTKKTAKRTIFAASLTTKTSELQKNNCIIRLKSQALLSGYEDIYNRHEGEGIRLDSQKETEYTVNILPGLKVEDSRIRLCSSSEPKLILFADAAEMFAASPVQGPIHMT